LQAIDHHLSSSDANSTEKLRVLTAALNAYIRIRTADTSLSSIKADSLAQLLFMWVYWPNLYNVQYRFNCFELTVL